LLTEKDVTFPGHAEKTTEKKTENDVTKKNHDLLHVNLTVHFSVSLEEDSWFFPVSLDMEEDSWFFLPDTAFSVFFPKRPKR